MASSKVARELLRLPPLPTPADLLRFYRIRALKQLSQNFLLDPNICSKLVRSAGNLTDNHVIEIGPGPGNLTRPIIERAKSYAVIEKDPRFIPSLRLLSEACDKRLQVVQGDVLSYPIESLIPDEFARPWESDPPPIHIIGNLPFAISTHLVVKWMKAVSERSGAWSKGRVPMTLTFQMEVAERLIVDAGHPERSRLSVIVQGYCNTKHTMTIGGGSFVPRPDVDVGVVRLVPRVEPVFKQEFDLVERVLNCMFNTKRRSSRRALSNLVPPPLWSDIVPELARRADIDLNEKCSNLFTEQFAAVCDAYADLCREVPGLSDYNYRHDKKELYNELKHEKWLRRKEDIAESKEERLSRRNDDLAELKE